MEAPNRNGQHGYGVGLQTRPKKRGELMCQWVPPGAQVYSFALRPHSAPPLPYPRQVRKCACGMEPTKKTHEIEKASPIPCYPFCLELFCTRAPFKRVQSATENGMKLTQKIHMYTGIPQPTSRWGDRIKPKNSTHIHTLSFPQNSWPQPMQRAAQCGFFVRARKKQFSLFEPNRFGQLVKRLWPKIRLRSRQMVRILFCKV